VELTVEAILKAKEMLEKQTKGPCVYWLTQFEADLYIKLHGSLPSNTKIITPAKND